ncbi:MAG: diguanylate cyclase [Treponema sp.]|jgi:diguanylate cyclase (GGDEF)-like protein|nr:diguanylate cyclase [Treponema sp.]
METKDTKTTKDRVLIIDDEKTNLMMLNTILAQDYTIFIAKSGQEGLSRAGADKPDLILLDILMPGMDGFEVLRTLKAQEDTMSIPVIIISALDNENDEEQGFMLGAVDYIVKPFKNTIVKARIKTQIQILHQIRMIERMGMIDGLTDIANRRCFDDRIALEWWRAIRKQQPLSFMMMDVDHFKAYNDTYGHPQGDILLKTIAKIFTSAVMRPVDLAARIGGEEFGILLPETELAIALQIAEKIRSQVESTRIPTTDGKIITTITLSIGVVSLIPTKALSLEEFIARADRNLYTAKKTGRNRICWEA